MFPGGSLIVATQESTTVQGIVHVFDPLSQEEGIYYKGHHTIPYILNIYIYAVNKTGVSCRKQGISWTKIAFLFKCS